MGAYGLVDKLSMGTWRTWVPLPALVSSFLLMQPWEAVVRAQVTESLIPPWETGTEFPAPGFDLAQDRFG